MTRVVVSPQNLSKTWMTTGARTSKVKAMISKTCVVAERQKMLLALKKHKNSFLRKATEKQREM